jgi:hypothetical protein
MSGTFCTSILTTSTQSIAQAKKVFLFYAAVSEASNNRVVTRSSFSRMAVDLGCSKVFPSHVATSIFDAHVSMHGKEDKQDGGRQQQGGDPARASVLEFAQWRQATLSLAHLLPRARALGGAGKTGRPHVGSSTSTSRNARRNGAKAEHNHYGAIGYDPVEQAALFEYMVLPFVRSVELQPLSVELRVSSE